MHQKEDWFSVLSERHGIETQAQFEHANVAICGLGGLGSNIAVALARAGIGLLHLIDFDRVELSNLHRQQYNYSQIGEWKTEALARNLSEINPYLHIRTTQARITKENALSLLCDSTIVCEAFDDPNAKAILAETVLREMPEKYLIAASGMAGFGEANAIQTRKVTEHFYVCGDFVSDVSDEVGLVSTRVMLCAAHQAHKVLQILKKEGNNYE